MDGNINPTIPGAGVTLKIGISTAKPSNSKKPRQKGGTQIQNSEIIRIIWSVSLFFFAAHKPPSNMENTIISASERTTNCSVCGKYLAKSSATSFVEKTDSPKSP